jgi:8-oxo-dGTP pyrophosphatase MutT (NUDIX family)
MFEDRDSNRELPRRERTIKGKTDIFRPGTFVMSEIIETISSVLADYSPFRADSQGRIEAAVALILVEGEDDLEILLIKRTERDDDPWSGQIALPGGRIEKQDRSLLETATRETMEETAVELTRGQMLGELDDLSTSTPLLPPMLVRPFVFSLESKQPVIHSEEVAEHFWISLPVLLDSRVTEDIEVQGYSLTVDGFRFGEHLLWGMTDRILTGFQKLVW